MKRILNLILRGWQIQQRIESARKQLKTYKELENEYHKKLENPDCSATIRKYSKLLEEVRDAKESCYSKLGHDLLHSDRFKS